MAPCQGKAPNYLPANRGNLPRLWGKIRMWLALLRERRAADVAARRGGARLTTISRACNATLDPAKVWRTKGVLPPDLRAGRNVCSRAACSASSLPSSMLSISGGISAAIICASRRRPISSGQGGEGVARDPHLAIVPTRAKSRLRLQSIGRERIIRPLHATSKTRKPARVQPFMRELRHQGAPAHAGIFGVRVGRILGEGDVCCAHGGNEPRFLHIEKRPRQHYAVALRFISCMPARPRKPLPRAMRNKIVSA